MCESRTITERILDEQKETNRLLRELLFKPTKLSTIAPPNKRERIAQIQSILGVDVDGIIGPKTRRAFNCLEQ